MSVSEISVPNSKLILSFQAQGVTLPVTSLVLSQFSEDSDALGAEEQERGVLIIGANGDGVFSRNGERGVTFVFKLLQGSSQSKTLDEILKLEDSGSASIVVSGVLVQTDSLQEETFTDGFFMSWMPVPTRGKGAAQSPSYKVQFVTHEKAAL